MEPGTIAGVVIGCCAGVGLLFCLYSASPMLRRLIALQKQTCKQKNVNALRVGILGAANIAPMALIFPARKMEDVVVAAVAARNLKKAQKFAQKYGIETVHETYYDLLDDDSIDIVYNPLPNGMQAFWTIEALKRGKHVLCEKPLASNAKEVEAMIQAATNNQPKDGRKQGLLLVEAFHYRFHPLAREIHRLVESGELGEVSHVEASFEIPWPFPPKSDIRFDLNGSNSELAGGSLMDAGCYAVNVMRLASGRKEPSEVETSKIVEAYKGVDQSADSRFAFENGMTARIKCAFRGLGLVPKLKVEATKFDLYVYNYLAPFIYHRLELTNRITKEKVVKKFYENGASTYEYQLRAFVGAVRGDEASIDLCNFAGSPEDSLKNMRVIDAIYEKSGLNPRSGKPIP